MIARISPAIVRDCDALHRKGAIPLDAMDDNNNPRRWSPERKLASGVRNMLARSLQYPGACGKVKLYSVSREDLLAPRGNG